MPFAECSDASIYYEASGRGPAIVFAHGAGGNRLSWWQQVPHFESSHRVIRIDHRGFGRTRCEPDDFHPKHFASDLIGVLDAESVDRAALVCQSMGGWTGLHTAIRHPQRVRCLALCGTPGGLLSPKIQQAAATMASRVRDEGISGNAALAPDFPKREPQLAFLYDQINGLNSDLAPELLRRLFEPEARVEIEQLEGYAVPTLMLAGDQDQLFPLDALREVSELIPGADLEVLPGSGHSTYFEQPGPFNRLVSEFISRH